MVLEPAETIHVMSRRSVEDEPRRHFVGQVLVADATIARVEGFTYVFNPSRGEFVKRADKRVRIVSLIDAANIINVLPRDVDLEGVRYAIVEGNRLVVTDGKTFRMDVNEFGVGGR